MSQPNDSSKSKDPFSPIAGAPQMKESKSMNNDSTPGSIGAPQAMSTPIYHGGGVMKTISTPINALLRRSSPKKDAVFSDLIVRKPKVRFADLEGGLLEEDEEGESQPKRYRLTPAVTREASIMPESVPPPSPIRTPTFPTGKALNSVMFHEPSTSMSQQDESQSMSQVPNDLTPWSMGFRSNVSTNVGEVMDTTEPISASSDYLAKLREEDDETEPGIRVDDTYLTKLREENDETDETEPRIRVDDTYLTKLRGDDGREMAEPIQAENAYLTKMREYRRCMLDFIKKKGEQRDTIQQVEEAIRFKKAQLEKSMRKVDGEIKAALDRLRSVKFSR